MVRPARANRGSFGLRARSLSRALAGARKSPLIQLAAVGAIALSLLLVGVVQLTAFNLRRLAPRFGADVQMTVYLDDGVSDARARQLASAIGALPGVIAVRVVDAHEAWQRLQRSLAGHSDLLAGLEEGFMPTSIEVSLKPGVAKMMRAHPAFERLRHTPGVDDVELSGDWAARLQALERLLNGAGAIVLTLVVCACLYVVGSTIRLGVFARREEIELWKLVGATDNFVKAPFWVEGALQGVLGTAVATVALYGLYRAATPRLATVLSGWLTPVPITFFPPAQVALALGCGALLGLCGAALALGRYVKI